MDWFLSLVFMSECINAWSNHLSIGIFLDGPIIVYKYSQVFFFSEGGIDLNYLYIYTPISFYSLEWKLFYECRKNWEIPANIK